MTERQETRRYTPPPGSIPTLDVPSLDGVSRLHLIGIGGAGMRNLAKLLLARGIAVSGSDLKDSKGLAELRVLGADVQVGHDPAHVRAPDLAASLGRETAAFKDDVRKLKALGLTISHSPGYELSPRGRALLDRL